MIVRELIEQANLLATGSKSTVSASQQTKTLLLANILQRDWQNESFSQPDKRWNSLKRLAEVRLSQASRYDLEDGFLGVAHRAKFKVGDEVVNPQYQIVDGQIVFNDEFIRQYSGQTLTYEFYQALDELDDLDQDIAIDNPNWLVYMVAGEIVRPDPVMGHQYSNLVAMAQSAMQAMKQRDAVTTIPAKMTVRRIN